VSQTSWNAAYVTVIRASHTAEDGVDVFVDQPDGPELLERFANAGVIRVDAETLETLRIEAGVPRFGVDMDETNVVSETNLDDAVSFTKGCYIGQEIIARIKYRGHVAKKLTGLTLTAKNVPAAGAVIRSNDGKDIGRVTSATLSPKLDSAIALGYVRYEYLATGSQVVIGEEGLVAKVTDLPFVRGSWYKMSDEL
jgi:folate-binding protein YgfZ